MENNTIAYLNIKIWYRLLKVVYVFIFISVSIYTVSTIVDDYSPYKIVDWDKSLILCDNGDTYTFNELSHKNLGFTLEENTDQLGVKRLCGGITNEFLDKKYGPNSNSQISPEDFLKSKGFYDTPKDINYKTKTIYKTIGGWHLVFGYSIFWILMICTVLEIIKRAFYYIVLGKINPPKNNL